MKELSFHILDLGINSIQANAKLLKITIQENIYLDFLKIKIEDDGCGMNDELLLHVNKLFFTTKKGNNRGLGIPLVEESILKCNGSFCIYSQKGKGTSVFLTYKYCHENRTPLGNIGQTIATLLNFSENIDIVYLHLKNNNIFLFDSRDIKKVFDNVDIREPNVLMWLVEYINTNINKLTKEE